MENFLFVYGLLRIDLQNTTAELLRRHADYLGQGYVNGRLFDIGEYPGLTLDKKNNYEVKGDVFLLNDLEMLNALDDFEGIGDAYSEPYEYERRKIRVYVNNGMLSCWAYLYNWPVSNSKEILSGDYTQWRS